MGIQRLQRETQTWIGNHPATNHHGMATRLLSCTQGILHIPNFTIGDQRYFDQGTYICDARPISGGTIPIGLSSCVHHDFIYTASFQCLRTRLCLCVMFKAKPHFGANHLVCRYRRADSTHNAVQQFRVLQQSGAPAMAIHLFGWTPKIQIHPVASHTCHTRRVLR